MPQRSRRAHNLTVAIGGTFALLLLLGSFLASQRRTGERSASLQARPGSSSATQSEGQVIHTPEGDVAGAEQTKQPGNSSIPIDSSAWTKYKDPLYKFEVKFPPEWAKPVAKRINDPDFDYEYQVSFGTRDTLSGNGIEGFDVFVFQTDKCGANGQADSGSGSMGRCATRKTQVSTGTPVPENIFEFSGKAYTYTVVPLIPSADVDPTLNQKVDAEIAEASKTFSFDNSLQLPAQKNPTQTAPAKPAAPPVSNSSRSGKLTGAKASGGKLVCPHPGRKPQRSPNKGNHVDEDCCPDPDEWPNAACAYKPSDFAIMLKR